MKSLLLVLSLSLLLVGCGEDVVVSYYCYSIYPVGYYNCYLSDDDGSSSFSTCHPNEQESVAACVDELVSRTYPECGGSLALNNIPTSGSFECEEQ